MALLYQLFMLHDYSLEPFEYTSKSAIDQPCWSQHKMSRSLRS